jgi:hypothetical protein
MRNILREYQAVGDEKCKSGNKVARKYVLRAFQVSVFTLVGIFAIHLVLKHI